PPSLTSSSASSSGARASRCSTATPTFPRSRDPPEDARWRRSVSQQSDSEVDQDETAEPEDRAGHEDQSNNHRIDVHVSGQAGADAENLAVGTVEPELARRARCVAV